MQQIGVLVEALAGLSAAFFMDAIWRTKFWGKDRGWLRVIEHYHWGFVFCLVGLFLENIMVISLGFGLIIAEELQPHPFSIGSDHFWWSTILGVILMCLTMFFYLVKLFNIHLI